MIDNQPVIDEHIFKIVQKNENELSDGDKEYLNSFVDSDNKKLEFVLYCNPYLLKYIDIKGSIIDLTNAIELSLVYSRVYNYVKDFDEFKKLNINSKSEMIYYWSINDDSLFNFLSKIRTSFENILDEEEIFKDFNSISNDLVDYLNDDMIMQLIHSDVKIPSITNDINKINELIDNGNADIINFINPNLLTDDLIFKALSSGYRISDETPDLIKSNSKYVRYYIEHHSNDKTVINFLSDDFLSENDDLVYWAIDNGYYYKARETSSNKNLIITNPNGYSPDILKTDPRFIKYFIEHDHVNIVDYVSEDVLKNNFDLLLLAKECGYRYNYINGFATKLLLQDEIKNQRSISFITSERISYNSAVFSIFDDYQVAYDFIKYTEMNEKQSKDLFLEKFTGFNELGYTNLILSMAEFGDLLLLKKMYKNNNFKYLILENQSAFVKICPNSINSDTDLDRFFSFADEILVDMMNSEKINQYLVKFAALNMGYYGSNSPRIREILSDKEYRDLFADTLLDYNYFAIAVLLDYIKYDDDEFKDRLILKAIDSGYEISKYENNYMFKYKFIKRSIEKGHCFSLDCVSSNILTKEQIKELFLLARSQNYSFNSDSPQCIIDSIVDDRKIMDYVFDTISSDEISYLFNFQNIFRYFPDEQLDFYLKKILYKKIVVSQYFNRITLPRFLLNDDLFKILLDEKPIEQLMVCYYSYPIDYNLDFKSKLSSEQLECFEAFASNQQLLFEYFQGKNVKQIYNECIKDNVVWHKAFLEKPWDLFQSDKLVDKLNAKELFAIKMYSMIDDHAIGQEFQSYVTGNFDSLNNDKIERFANVFKRLAVTNSKSLYSIRKSLTQQLLSLDNPEESYNQIESVFIRNNIPLYAKMYFCFRILYPNLTNSYGNMKFDDSSRMSPELKDSSLADINIKAFLNNPSNNDIRFYIIYNDLLRNAVMSNSKDLRKYLDNIELGDYLYKKIIGENVSDDKFDSMSDLDKNEALDIFISHLGTIYKYTHAGKLDDTDLSNYDLVSKIKYFKDHFKVTKRFDFKDRIVRSFGYSAGYTSYSQIREDMRNAVSLASSRCEGFASELDGIKFEFDDGDFLRCIGDYQSFAGSIENGNFSKEFLTVFRYANDSDLTPLDIDFTLVEKKESIYHSIVNTHTGFHLGNVFLVIKKDNPNLNVTRDGDGNLTGVKYDPKKIEMFGTGVTGFSGFRTHWGVRTGLSLTDVDYVLYKEARVINEYKPYNDDGSINYDGDQLRFDDLSRIKFEIARHGHYIPVIDFKGDLIFSVDEYSSLRNKMSGLSYYDIDSYNFSDNLVIPGVEEIISEIDYSNKEIIGKREKLYDVLSSVFQKYSLNLKNKIDGDLTPGSIEVIDTGSTSRKTNKLYDGDFDLLLRIDQQIFRNSDKYNRLCDDIRCCIGSYPYEEFIITDKGDYRFKKVQIDSDTVIDIDLSFTIKTDKVTYSTDECLKDRLKTMEKQDFNKYQQVISNIIIAKQVLKAAECYKPSRSDRSQGGLGGSGIENWILQNGGSFKDAAVDFLRVADECDSFEDFKMKYFVWDFGENHFAERKGEYVHDNFVDNMNPIGFEKMKDCLKKYLIELDKKDIVERQL